MFEAILAPYDGSRSSDRALEAAIGLAGRTGATLHVVYVVDLEDVPGDVDDLLADRGLAVEAAGQELLADAVDRARDAGVAVERALVRGPAATALLEYAEAEPVDLVVIGAHEGRRLRRFLHRSVVDRVVRAAPMPVLTVPEAGEAVPRTYRTVLLATDGRAGSRRATDVAFDLAETYDAQLRGLYVLDSRFTSSSPLRSVLERQGRETERALGRRAARAGIEFRYERREGSPAREILAAAEEYDADLVVIGTRGRTGLDRLFLGSVAGRVVRESPVPVLTVQPVEGGS